LIHRSVVNDLIGNVAFIVQLRILAQPGTALITTQLVEALKRRAGVPEVPGKGVVNVVVGERHTGHDPVHPAHAVCYVAVDGGDLVTTANTPGHGANLNEFVLLVETDVRGASISLTSVTLGLSSYTQPGGMDSERFSFEPFVSPELTLALCLSHYWHLNLLQGVAEVSGGVISICSPSTGPAILLSREVLPGLRQTDGADVLLIDKVILGDEDGEIVGDPLVVIIRMEPDSYHLRLLGLYQFILSLDIVLPTPGEELAVVQVDLVSEVSRLPFVPGKKYYQMFYLSNFYLHHPELVTNRQKFVWCNERSSANVDSLSRQHPVDDTHVRELSRLC